MSDVASLEATVKRLSDLVDESGSLAGAILKVADGFRASDGNLLVALALVQAYMLDRIASKHGTKSSELAAEMVRDVIQALLEASGGRLKI